MSKLITVPFGWLLGQLYNLTDNYGVAMIIFALVVQTVMLPMRAKSKKSSMKMSRIQPMIQDIQARYTDPQKQNEMMRKLYQEEGVSLGGGCLWSLIPILIIFPLFAVIRQPMTYILGATAEEVSTIVQVIKDSLPELFSSARAGAYDQVIAAGAIADCAEQIKAALPNIDPAILEGINFDFLSIGGSAINLGLTPSWRFWTWDAWTWGTVGAALIPVLSTGSQLIQTLVMQKMNNSLITDKNGLQDKETAKNSQQNKSMSTMLWIMPFMTLMIGYSVSAGLSLYWFVGGLYTMISDVIMTKKFRTQYDAEDAERLKRHMEALRLEEEKERIRAERRAANPDGITSNTSKKKLQKQQRDEEAAARAAAAREYAAKKGISIEEAEKETSMSGIPDRPFCKGRNYDPNRYNSTEE
ncbi:MAG: membrane protein insertase YidC [Oscillospiraceae bacterium]|nr:membrane protein insertase YidC [Oscillospiraceae bacterium]